MVKQFCEDFVKIHLDSTCPRASRVGALIYDSEAGWSHKTLGCLSRSWTKATCLYSILYMSGVPSPSSIDYKHIKHHQNHRLFCTAVRTFYILLHSTFEYLRWEGQPIHAMPDIWLPKHSGGIEGHDLVKTSSWIRQSLFSILDGLHLFWFHTCPQCHNEELIKLMRLQSDVPMQAEGETMGFISWIMNAPTLHWMTWELRMTNNSNNILDLAVLTYSIIIYYNNHLLTSRIIRYRRMAYHQAMAVGLKCARQSGGLCW